MSSKRADKVAGFHERFSFSAFKIASNGAMVVERGKLHESDGYKRQVEALTVLRDRRKETSK